MIEWGTMGEWASGLATAGALYLALTTIRREQNQRRRQEADAIRAHAEHIDAWIPRPWGQLGDGRCFQTVMFCNLSDQPVRDAWLEVLFRDPNHPIATTSDGSFSST